VAKGAKRRLQGEDFVAGIFWTECDWTTLPLKGQGYFFGALDSMEKNRAG